MCRRFQGVINFTVLCDPKETPLLTTRLTTLLAAAVLAGGCAHRAAAPNSDAAAPLFGSAAEPLLQPNAHLHAQGIAPIPQALADRVSAYNDFRGHGLVDWHPVTREMLVAHRPEGASVTQVFRLRAPGGALEPFTVGSEPVTQALWEPRQGRYAVYQSATGGSEVYQLFRLDTPGQPGVQITPDDQRHSLIGWLAGKGEIIYGGVPLDRTAQGGTRAQVSTTLWRMDPLAPQGRRQIAQLDGGGWEGIGREGVSPDETQLVLQKYISANESQVWLMDLATGSARQVLPVPGQNLRATHVPQAFSRDARSLWFTTDRFGEFNELARLDLASGAITRVSRAIAWDVTGMEQSPDGRTLAVQVNADGRSELHWLDAVTFAERAAPAAMPRGAVGGMLWSRTHGELAFGLSSSQAPGQVFSVAPSGALATWTQPHVPAGIDTARFAEQQVVRWNSFDGRSISGLIARPDPARFAGKRPVLVVVHGGPEGQATVGFQGRMNYFTNELGVALIEPNVRGSAGYGKTFLALDNGFQREDSVKDLGTLLDWIATQPDLDPARVVVMGGSYGGYMSLAASTHFADRIAGAVDVVGISHFVTFLENTESYRRDLRRVEYGDERDPAMRAFLDRISPLTNASKIRKPLFVVQGKNDPRVPASEAEQMVDKLRAAGHPTWYLRADNEGHGFRRKENADYQFYATILFARQVLLGR